jgi:hypothetical protein
VRVLEDTLVERVSERAARIDELEGFADKQEATNRALRERLQAECRVSKMHEDVRNATREILGCTPAEQEDRKAKTLALRVEACDREHTDLVETRAVLRCTPYDNTANKANAIMQGVKALVKLINTVVLSRSLMKGTDPMPALSAPERESLVRAAAPLLKLFEGED